MGLFSVPTQAAIITVGTPVGGGQCNCDTIQCAFDFAQFGGPHTVRITRALSYSAVHAVLTRNSNEVITIEGGYANCTQGADDGTKTVVSGQGGGTDSVFEFNLSAGATVNLRLLQIQGGDHTDGNGGGIDQNGGHLRIDDSLITNNVATKGGGIYSENGLLEIGANVLISNNSATDGGGVALSESDMSMDEAGSLILVNHADTGYGGGLWVGPGSLAEIGAPALPGLGALYGNTAAHGGGAAIISGENVPPSARLIMHSLDPANPTGIIGNLATQRGGGLFLRAACCDPAEYQASANFNGNAYISDNQAPEGAAAYLDKDSGDDVAGTLEMTDGVIALNQARMADSTPTNGAVIYLADDPGLGVQGPRGIQLTRTRLQSNEGGHLIRSDGRVILTSSLITHNIARLSLIRAVGSDGRTNVFSSTITANTITPNQVFETSNDFLLKTSILHQPGKNSLLRTGGARVVEDVVASEIATLTDIPNGTIVQVDPQFWDPASNDFHLHAASMAVDASASGGGTDLEGNPRVVDLPLVGDRGGPTDLGPFERQEFLPLVRNHTFVNSNLWQLNGGAFVADSAQADGSGGIYVAAEAPLNGRVIGPIQCVPLPSRGNYGLRGWGKEPSTSMANADYPRLEWQLYLGNTLCSGAASSVGGIALPSGNDWALSAQTFFQVPNDGNLRPLASVLIWLVAVDNNASGTNLVDAYFDNIILEHTGEGNLSPTIVSPLFNREDTEGDYVSIETAPKFTDPDGDTLTFSATNLPDGVSIDPVGGAIVGTLSMSSAGIYSVLVTAKDPFNASVSQAFGWTVNDLFVPEEVFTDGFESP